MSDRIKIDGFISAAVAVVFLEHDVHTHTVSCDGWPRKQAIEKQGQSSEISVHVYVRHYCGD